MKKRKLNSKNPKYYPIKEEEVKERIYASLKQDIMRRNADTSCKEEINERDKLRWKTLPHQNINTNEQQKQQPNGVISGNIIMHTAMLEIIILVILYQIVKI